MVVLAVHLHQLGAEVGTHAGEHLARVLQVLAGQHPTPILGHEDQMHVERRDDVSASTVVVILSHRPNILSGMLVRYRYRIDPTLGQRQALARAFGCARVVYNDALAERQRAYGRGAAQRHRGATPGDHAGQADPGAGMAGRGRLGGAGAGLQGRAPGLPQLVRLPDSGKRKGRRVGRPRFRTKQGRQSIRLTRNGFALHGTRLYVAKVGDAAGALVARAAVGAIQRHRHPRADGRYYASFVVERDPTPLPPVSRTAGIDLGLARFATVAASDGTVERIANPRHLRDRRAAAGPRPAAASSASGRGRPTGPRPAVRVAVAHRKVRDRRADHHHKLALRLIRENQAVAVEDLVRGRAWPGPGWPRASTTPAGRRSSGCWRRRPPSTGARSSRSVAGSRPPRPARVRAAGRPQAAGRPRLDLPGVRGRPRPGRQRGPQHPCRRRAGGDAKRLWRQCQPRATPAVASEAGTRRGAA